MKKGLLIQGPMISSGFSPYHFTQHGKYERVWIDYNAINNVMKIIDDASKFFDIIVISTWDNPTAKQFISLKIFPRNVFIVLSSEKDIPRERISSDTHKYHQIYSSLVGALRLESLGCEIIAKVRTDQFVNLEELSKSVDKHQKKPKYSIGVPYLNIFEMDRLTDFYLVSRASVMIETFRNYLSLKESYQDTHKDYFHNFSKIIINLSGIDKIKYFNNLNKYPHKINLLVWSTIFYPLDPKLYTKFLWRGIKVNHKINGWIRFYKLLTVSNYAWLPFAMSYNSISLNFAKCFRVIMMRPQSYVLFHTQSRKSSKQ